MDSTLCETIQEEKGIWVGMVSSLEALRGKSVPWDPQARPQRTSFQGIWIFDPWQGQRGTVSTPTKTWQSQPPNQKSICSTTSCRRTHEVCGCGGRVPNIWMPETHSLPIHLHPFPGAFKISHPQPNTESLPQLNHKLRATLSRQSLSKGSLWGHSQKSQLHPPTKTQKEVPASIT